MYSLIPKVLSNPSPCLFFFSLFIKALKRAILSGNSTVTCEVRIFSNSALPFSMFPVRLIADATNANLIVDGLGAGAESA